MQMIDSFDIEHILKCFAEEDFTVEPISLRYHIAKEIETEYLKDTAKAEEKTIKLLKGVPEDIYNEYVIADEIQMISCKLKSPPSSRV